MSSNNSSGNSSSGLQLKLDNWVKRDPDRSARNIPIKPLSIHEKQYLAGICQLNCLKAYHSRMKKSALLSDFEEDQDLIGEAYIAMWNILDKFDTSKCGKILGLLYTETVKVPEKESKVASTKKSKKKSPPAKKTAPKEKTITIEHTIDEWIAKGATWKTIPGKASNKNSYPEYKLYYKGQELQYYDIPGQKKPKSLRFYFVNYFSGRVNFIACESRAQKKQRGVGPAEQLAEVGYNPEDNSEFSKYQSKHEITEAIFSELEKKDKELKRFFYQSFVLECTQRELREEYKEKYNVLKSEVQKFLKEVSAKSKVNYSA